MPTITQPGTIQETDEAIREKTLPPYKVIFLNDNVTTMDFVVHILIAIFKKDPATAVELMLETHNTGAAVVDVLPLEEAELRQQQTIEAARSAGFPLRCVIEPA
ncbi:MAG TPA: ATP-dependent Clp protease adaptor ClpS [Nitrospiria bacterium]|jgi:ATP-dependent Clp protease adaptor protein ClpS|nr:ATP-dependent Clp protease adaptor ClpS [Nitrospiria bacterium]